MGSHSSFSHGARGMTLFWERAWSLPQHRYLGAIAYLTALKELVLPCAGFDMARGAHAFLKQLIPPNLEILELYNRGGPRSMDNFFASAADLFPKLDKDAVSRWHNTTSAYSLVGRCQYAQCALNYSYADIFICYTKYFPFTSFCVRV